MNCYVSIHLEPGLVMRLGSSLPLNPLLLHHKAAEEHVINDCSQYYKCMLQMVHYSMCATAVILASQVPFILFCALIIRTTTYKIITEPGQTP